MTMLEDITYWTLNETVSYLDNGTYPPSGNSIVIDFAGALQDIIDDWDQGVAETYSFIAVDASDNRTVKPNATKLLSALFNRYERHIATITKDPHDADAATREGTLGVACYRFVLGLFSTLSLTFPRYDAILAAYAAEEGHLLDAVRLGAESLTRFNDAPQNSGDYSGDTYASNYTVSQGSQESDHGTPIERLREIEAKYNDVIRDWLAEFANMFILEENLS